jgi:hypothetical protein
MIYNLDNLTYSNAFNLHSCANFVEYNCTNFMCEYASTEERYVPNLHYALYCNVGGLHVVYTMRQK